MRTLLALPLFLYACSTRAAESTVAAPGIAEVRVVDASLPPLAPEPEVTSAILEKKEPEIAKIAKEWMMPSSGIPSAEDFREVCVSFKEGRLSTSDMTSADGRSVRWAQCRDADQNTRLQVVDLKSKESVALFIENGDITIAGDGSKVGISLHYPSDAIILPTEYLWKQESLNAGGRVFPNTEFDVSGDHGGRGLNASRMSCLAYGSADPEYALSDLYDDCLMGSEFTSIDTWITPTRIEGGYACCDSAYALYRYDLKAGKFSFPRTSLELASFAKREDAEALVARLEAGHKNATGDLDIVHDKGSFKVGYGGYFTTKEARREGRLLKKSKLIKKFEVVGRPTLSITWKERAKLNAYYQDKMKEE